MSGYTGTQMELLYSLQAPVTTTTFTTATAKPISAITGTAIPRCIIPAGFFDHIGKSISVYGAGTLSNLATTATFIFTTALDVVPGTLSTSGAGGNTLWTTAAQAPTGSVVCPFEYNLDIVATAVGGGNSGGVGGTTLQLNGNISLAITASPTSWTAGQVATKIATSVGNINNEINLWYELFGTFTGTTTGCQTVLQQLKVYGEN
jgi:hypothetical protein